MNINVPAYVIPYNKIHNQEVYRRKSNLNATKSTSQKKKTK